MGCETVLVVGGSPMAASIETVARASARAKHVCAVDRGFDRAIEAGLAPELFCGDGDSISAEGAEALRRLVADGRCEVERYNPDKDFTDLALALRAVHGRWGNARVVATCLDGGRADHALGALGCLAFAACGPVELEEEAYEGRILHAGEAWELRGAVGRQFSFIPLAAGSVVSEEGMKWELDHHACPLLSDLGVSNVLTADPARFSCHEGTVVAYCMR